MVTKRILLLLGMTCSLAAMEQQDNNQLIPNYAQEIEQLTFKRGHIKGYIVLGDHEVPIYTLDYEYNDSPDSPDTHPATMKKIKIIKNKASQ